MHGVLPVTIPVGIEAVAADDTVFNIAGQSYREVVGGQALIVVIDDHIDPVSRIGAITLGIGLGTQYFRRLLDVEMDGNTGRQRYHADSLLVFGVLAGEWLDRDQLLEYVSVLPKTFVGDSIDHDYLIVIRCCKSR